MGNLKPIKLKIYYDDSLKKITEKDFEEAFVSENLSFYRLLSFIFSSYPKIQKIFIPGALGFLLNGRRPAENDALKDGDDIMFIDCRNKSQIQDH